MRRILVVLIVLAFACPAASVVAATPGRFIQYPDISGNTIVFNWERDLWVVPAGGGMATRLTTHPGGENVPKFSPDGKQIVFRASTMAGRISTSCPRRAVRRSG